MKDEDKSNCLPCDIIRDLLAKELVMNQFTFISYRLDSADVSGKHYRTGPDLSTDLTFTSYCNIINY